MDVSAPVEADLQAVLALSRPEILALKPYAHAEWQPQLERLHANELPWRASADTSGSGLNRYPEPQPQALLDALAALYGVPSSHLLVSRGSDEAIDLLTRAFCRAGQDAVIVTPPTFGMYAVAARIQAAIVVEVPLDATAGFKLNRAAVINALRPNVKLVFLCSPNNPTGNCLGSSDLLQVVKAASNRAVVVIDEAYIEFADVASLAMEVARYPNLVVLRTLSKAHGLAGARLGTLIARPGIVALLRRIIPPYAIAQPTVEAALSALSAPQQALTRERIRRITTERSRLAVALASLPSVRRVWPSAGNFLLVEFLDAQIAFAALTGAGLLVRDFRGQAGLQHSLRLTLGTPIQNDRMLQALQL